MVPSKKSVRSAAFSNCTVNIQIGSVCCALKCKDDSEYNLVKRLYRDFLTEQPVDLTLELEMTSKMSPADVGEALPETIFTHENGNSFRTSSQIVSGRYDLANRIISITAEKSLSDPDVEFNYINRLISLVYYSACKVKYGGNPPAMLVHSCGIVRHGKAIAFVGPSETGKSTIARLCGDQHGEVLNDEMVLISRPNQSGNGICAQGAPIISEMSPRCNKVAPLHCILMLKRGGRTVVRDLDKAEAFLKFMRQIITPVYIGQKSGRAVYTLMADFTSEVIDAIPIYELEFNLDGEALWQVVTELE